MLFGIFVILAIVFSVVGTFYCYWKWNSKKFPKINTFIYRTEDWVQPVAIVLAFVGIIGSIVSVFVMIGMNADAAAQKAKLNETYTAIEYKITSGACRDELGLLTKEVIDEAQEYNETISYYKTMQDSFWLGVYVPDIYNDFELIDYTQYNSEQNIIKDNLEG